MDKLILNINDYKSINQANIEINKLNVVSGVNGSGKSTLSRILYSFLKGNSTKRRDYLIERIVSEFNEYLSHFDKGYIDYDFPDAFKVTDTRDELIEKYNSLYEITKQHEKVCGSKVEELEKEVSEEFDSVLKKLEEEGLIKIDEIEFKTDDPFFRAFEVGKSIPNFDERYEKDFKKVFELNDEKEYFFNTQMANTDIMLLGHSLALFVEEDSYKVSEECFQSLLFKEEGRFTFIKNLNFEMELSNHSKVNAYEYFFNNGFIDKSYYFDNVSLLDLYFALDTEFNMKNIILNHTGEFISELFGDNDDETPDDDITFVLEKIENIIGGKYSSNLLPMFHTDKIDTSSFRISRRERKVTTLSDTPSGIKQMGIIQMLLLNNKLHKGDYLIIDEPEVNLHPEWQFKFAEILVLLAKQDITVYINSHSPLLIEAISAFSEYYDMLDDVNYYLSEPSEDEGKYDFVKINSDEIFRVYDNLGNAYDLIDQLRLKKRLGE